MKEINGGHDLAVLSCWSQGPVDRSAMSQDRLQSLP